MKYLATLNDFREKETGLQLLPISVKSRVIWCFKLVIMKNVSYGQTGTVWHRKLETQLANVCSLYGVLIG